MFFSGGLVPSYMLVTKLGLYDSPWAFILPGVSVWNVIVVRQYFVTRVSGEIFEAASIDGCSNFRFLVYIGVPLAVPIIIVISHIIAKINLHLMYNSSSLLICQLVM